MEDGCVAASPAGVPAGEPGPQSLQEMLAQGGQKIATQRCVTAA